MDSRVSFAICPHGKIEVSCPICDEAWMKAIIAHCISVVGPIPDDAIRGTAWINSKPKALEFFASVESNSITPTGTVYFTAHRKPFETEREWGKRCAVIHNIGVKK